MSLSLLLSLVFTAATMLAAAAPAREAARTRAALDAESFVEMSIAKGYAILNNTSLPEDERRREFRSFLLSIVDTRRAALFTLGPFARSASQQEIADIVAAYENFATAMYQGFFDWYSGQMLRVTSSAERSPNDVIVYAEVTEGAGAPQYKIGFRIRKNEAGQTVVTDFQFEGVWLALTQRSDFTSYLQQQNGNFAALAAELQTRTQRFREAWAPPTQR